MDERAPSTTGRRTRRPPGTPDDRRLTDATGVIWKTDTATVTGAEALCTVETDRLAAAGVDGDDQRLPDGQNR